MTTMEQHHSEARDRAAGVTSALLEFLAPFIRLVILGVALFAGVVILVWLILAVGFHLNH